MDQQTAILRTLQGETKAFNHLVLAYQNLAYNVALRMLQNENAAADAVQESFIKAYRALPSFHGGSFKSWLTRIVVNTCYDVLRVQQQRAIDSLDALPAGHESIPALVDRTEAPEVYAERMELNHWIEQGLRALPAAQRTVLALCDIHGYTYEEIAEVTGLPMGTVKSRIKRGRTRLRDYLLRKPELLPATFRPLPTLIKDEASMRPVLFG